MASRHSVAIVSMSLGMRTTWLRMNVLFTRSLIFEPKFVGPQGAFRERASARLSEPKQFAQLFGLAVPKLAADRRFVYITLRIAEAQNAREDSWIDHSVGKGQQKRTDAENAEDGAR